MLPPHPTVPAAPSLGLLLPLQTPTSQLIDSTFSGLANPNVAYLLLVLGLLGIFLELASPGASLPGVVGIILLILAAIGLSQLPVDWRGIALILIAFLLFVVDIFVPSLGLLTIGGLLLFMAGSYMLFDQEQGVAVSPQLIWAIAAGLVGLFLVVGGFALSVLRRKPATGREGLVGAVGAVRQTLDPDGIVFVSGELWQATATGGTDAAPPPIEAGVPVTVTGLDGLRLMVRRATATEAADAGVAVFGEMRPSSQQAALTTVDPM